MYLYRFSSAQFMRLAGQHFCRLLLLVALLHGFSDIASAQRQLAYTYKARNLQPEDFGYDDRSWEMTLNKMNGRLEDHPDDLGVLLQRAIAYREYGVRRSLLLRKRDWVRSRDDFEYIIAADSSFQDVLYQYAQLFRYRGDYEQALQLMHRQLEMDPQLAYVTVTLFRLYHEFLHEKKTDEVEAWLDSHLSGYAAFLEAELLRKTGRLRAADSRLSALLNSNLQIPPQPYLLARARIYYAMGELEKIAESFVKQAIDAIQNETQARLVLEDFKYILSDREMQEFFEAETPADYRTFFRGILEKRNPARSQETDQRLAEHYRRLLEAERDYALYESREAYRVGNNVSKDKMADADFPLAYWLNGEFGDKGLIFIRHGDPVDKVASVNEETSFIESWRYNAPDMDFHFEGHGSLAELIPVLPLDLEVLEAHEIWGGVYTRLTAAARDATLRYRSIGRRQSEMDLFTFNNELFDESLANVQEGLTSDRHEWSRDMRHLAVPHFVAAFQGADEQTDVEIYYSLPVGEVASELKDKEQIDIEVGIAVHDMDWNEVYSSLETFNVAGEQAPDAAAVNFIRFQALPDSFHVNLHAQIVGAEWMGSYQFDYRAPDYAPRSDNLRLMMSDLLPALEIIPAAQPGRYTKKGLYLRTNPGGGYRKEAPFFIYFEIYNLTFGSGDRTNFDITYTLQQPEGEGRKGLFRRRADGPSLSITYEREGEQSNVVEHGEIDMSAVPAGVYELKVEVIDRNTGAATSKTHMIELR